MAYFKNLLICQTQDKNAWCAITAFIYREVKNVFNFSEQVTEKETFLFDYQLMDSQNNQLNNSLAGHGDNKN